MTAKQAIDRLKAAGIDVRTAPATEVVEKLTELATELRWSNPAERANNMLAHLQGLTAILEGGE
jgi:predicted Fe-Mo cluster-binding NifX family protein